ncbi:MAG: hypothetical protein LBG28_12855 [Tannerella sp.]|jgi:hypothetical protein|nr:hypothetical protein [Tannerella sp.]
MFYVRINKMKVFDNREGFLGLFNRSAEMRIYSYVSNPAGTAGHILENGRPIPPLSISDLLSLDENGRREKLLEQVLAEARLLAQSKYMEINGVQDNQTLLFGDAGLAIYSSEQMTAKRPKNTGIVSR